MRKLLKWLLRGICFLVLLLVLGVLFRNALAKPIMEHQIAAETGMPTTIGSVEIGLIHPTFRVANLVIHNTADFGNGTFVSVPELYVEYDRKALFARKIHLHEVRFNLAEVNIIKTPDGRLNYAALTKKTTTEKKPSKPAPEFVGIDKLQLSLGVIRMKDLKTPEKVHEINLAKTNVVYENVKSPAQLSGLAAQILAENALDLAGLGLDLGLFTAGEAAKEAVGKAREKTGKLLNNLLPSKKQ